MLIGVWIFVSACALKTLFGCVGRENPIALCDVKAEVTRATFRSYLYRGYSDSKQGGSAEAPPSWSLTTCDHYESATFSTDWKTKDSLLSTER
jgi:hypothetical protein